MPLTSTDEPLTTRIREAVEDALRDRDVPTRPMKLRRATAYTPAPSRQPSVPWRAVGVVSLANGAVSGILCGVGYGIGRLVAHDVLAPRTTLEPLQFTALVIALSASLVTAGTALAALGWRACRLHRPDTTSTDDLAVWTGTSTYGIAIVVLCKLLSDATGHPGVWPIMALIATVLACPLFVTAGLLMEMAIHQWRPAPHPASAP